MFDRAKYKEIEDESWRKIPNPLGSKKLDGANFFAVFSADGSPSFISRRPSVKGGYPDRTASLPHLTDKKYPELAGITLNGELIHTGFNKLNEEKHNVLSGILNSLPPRAIETQAKLGPARYALHNVLNPTFNTYGEKLEFMKHVEKVIGKPDVFFVVPHHEGHEAIDRLITKTRNDGSEGVIVTSKTLPEGKENPRFKIKHKLLYNVQVIGTIRAVDISGNPKDEMGALQIADATGKPVGKVGTGFSRNERIDAFKNPSSWVGRHIQVQTLGMASNALRMPVYNGDADGDLDMIPS